MHFAKWHHNPSYHSTEAFSGSTISALGPSPNSLSATKGGGAGNRPVARLSDRLQVHAALSDPFFQKRLAVELMRNHPVDATKSYRLVSGTVDALRRDPYVQAWVVAALVESRRAQILPQREIVAELAEKSLLKAEIQEELLRNVIDLPSELLDEVIVDVLLLLLALALEDQPLH